ncbi:MAG: DNA adenine methylase [bacterium]|nr:DNA adenine methylase [bacterium]
MTLSLQPIPYQGSKRNIAEQVMRYAPKFSGRLIEPFAGSAAITIYAAHHGIANKFLINDSYKPLIDLWGKIIKTPEECASEYEKIWREQLDNPNDYYLRIREEFNSDNEPLKLLFLMVRCAKNAVRFNSSGKFNQSADKRRLGRRPQDMRRQILSTSLMLRRKIEFMNTDYETILEMATPDDLVYMDPPYQGTSGTKNPRYHQGLDFDRFVQNLQKLNERGIPFILSFDGQLGEKKYGQPLPEYLNLRHIPIPAGRSAQSTLNGGSDMTIESLYISPNVSVTHLPIFHPPLVAA